jgi:hypothetical protein
MLKNISQQLLRNTLGTALPQLKRQFHALYNGQYNLTKEELARAYNESKKLNIFKNHLQIQEHDMCLGTSAAIISGAAQEAAGEAPPPRDVDKNDSEKKQDLIKASNAMMWQDAGPTDFSEGDTRAEILAKMIKDQVKVNGPTLLHAAGIGGALAYKLRDSSDDKFFLDENFDENSLLNEHGDPKIVRDEEKYRAGGPYGVHAVCVVDVIQGKSGSYAVVIDPNDRSHHPAIGEFKDKNPGTALDKLSPEKLRELGLDNAMIYVAPLKEMIELSLLEHCVSLVEVGCVNKASPEAIIRLMQNSELPVSEGMVYTFRNPPPQFTKPDPGLKNLVVELEKNHRIVTANELQKKIDETKNAAILDPKSGQVFEEVWEATYGEEHKQTHARKPSR